MQFDYTLVNEKHTSVIRRQTLQDCGIEDEYAKYLSALRQSGKKRGVIIAAQIASKPDQAALKTWCVGHHSENRKGVSAIRRNEQRCFINKITDIVCHITTLYLLYLLSWLAGALAAQRDAHESVPKTVQALKKLSEKC